MHDGVIGLADVHVAKEGKEHLSDKVTKEFLVASRSTRNYPIGQVQHSPQKSDRDIQRYSDSRETFSGELLFLCVLYGKWSGIAFRVEDFWCAGWKYTEQVNAGVTGRG